MRWSRCRWLTTLIGVAVLFGAIPAGAAVDIAPGAAVGGVVIDQTGQPLAGVCIGLEGAAITGQRILPGPDLWFDDEISPHRADLNAAGNAGLILGTGGGTVGPDEPVTRAQAASLLTRLVDRTGRDSTR